MLCPSKNQLEQFLTLAKNAKGAAAPRFIEELLRAPGVFVFGEIIALPNIQELQNSPEQKKHWDVLQLFAYGKYSDFIENRASLPQLTEPQLHKLKLLTIVSMAEQQKRLPYNLLLSELALQNVRELEDLVIEAVYSDLIQGKLDQNNQLLEIESYMGRDVRQNDFELMNSKLKQYASYCDGMIGVLEEHLLEANTAKSQAHESELKLTDDIQKLKKSLKLSTGQSGMSAMETDDDGVSSMLNDDKKKEKRSKGALRGAAKFWRS